MVRIRYALISFFQKENKLFPIYSGLVVKALDSQSRVPFSKPLGGSKVNSVFHHSEIDKMSTSYFWELSGKK